MGAIAKLHHGQYFIFVNFNKERRAIPAGKVSKKAANTAAALLWAEILKKGMGILATTPSGDSLAVYAERWLTVEAPAGRKATTVDTYRDHFKRYILPRLGTVAVTKLTPTQVKEMLAYWRDKGLSENTLKAILRALSTALTDAGLPGASPTHKLSKFCKCPDAIKFEINPFTKAECSLFLNTTKEWALRVYPLFLMALRTGLRMGELLAVQWGDIDFAGHYVTVRRSRNPFGVLTPPKNGKPRRVDLSDQLCVELKALQARRTVEQLAKGWSPAPEEVFITRDGTPYEHANLRTRQFLKVLKKADLRHIRFHDLRHTYASLLIQAGESLTYVKEQMGHSSIKITVDIYGHLVPGANRAAVNRLDDDDATKRNQGATNLPTAAAKSA